MYVYNALISRSVVFEFKPLSADDIAPVLLRGLRRLNYEEFGSDTAEVTERENSMRHETECTDCLLYTSESGARLSEIVYLNVWDLIILVLLTETIL